MTILKFANLSHWAPLHYSLYYSLFSFLSTKSFGNFNAEEVKRNKEKKSQRISCTVILKWRGTFR